MPTIEDLEKEIELFRKNISGSNALMAALTSIVAVSKDQTQAFETKTAELQALIAKLPEDVKSEFSECIKSFTAEMQAERTRYENEIASLLEKYAKSFGDAEEKITGTPGNVEKVMNTSLEQMQAKVMAAQQQYAEQLKLATTQFVDKTTACMTQLDEKYSAFIAKLDATNVDQIYLLCEKINRSVNMKLNIALCGVGLAVVLAIIGFFI